ncbi:MAG: hypothetical protein K2J08_10475 [Ruminococcus sp.]|nr:hypothetical protein [Ruminococcus sp.]
MIHRIKIVFICFLMIFFTTISGCISPKTQSSNDEIILYKNIEFSDSDELRTASENEKFRLIVYDKTAIFGLQDKKTGYIWWSSPPEKILNDNNSQIAEEELNSSIVVRYGTPENNSDNNFIRSGGSECNVKISDIQGGIRIFYDFEKVGFSFFADYILEEKYLQASIKISEIIEKNPENIITEINFLENFGCADESENGYFIIPDGSGALINFNNNKTWSSGYKKRIYGEDMAFSDKKNNSENEQIYLPVYAIVREKNALMAVASKGDANAFLLAEISGQSGNYYNRCNFTFILRSKDTYFNSDYSGEKITVFEKGGINSGDIEVRFYPVLKEKCDFTDVAECYRNYLTDECNLTKKINENYSPLYVNFFGGVEKKNSILGIPIKKKQSLTNYENAMKILSDLRDKGVKNAVISYKNLTDNEIENKVETEIKPSSSLGGKNKFENLTGFISENNFEFYPDFDNIYFYSGNGFNSFSGAVFRITGVKTEIYNYNLAYGFAEKQRKNKLLLSPEYFSEIFSEISENCKKSKINGISLGEITSTLYGDYGKNKISRNYAKNIITENFSEINNNLKGGILAEGANAYALPYVSHIVNIPFHSGKNDLFDSEVPFYQAVIHGIIPYTSTPVNSDANIADFIMFSAVTGSNIKFDIIHENVNILKDTELDFLYYANYPIEKISEIYKIISPILENISLSTIVDYKVENSGEIISATYSNGTVITADFSRKILDFNGNKISLEEEFF